MSHQIALTLTVLLSTFTIAEAQGTIESNPGEWRYYGGDQGGLKYSPIDQINRENVDQLTIAWECKTGEKRLEEYGTRPGSFQNTPLMINEILYVSTPYNRVVAIEAETGKELWSFDPEAYKDGQPFNGTGFVHRGLAAWQDGERLRLFLNTRYRLFCLDATTGEPVPSFGEEGVIDLGNGLIWPIRRKHYSNTSPPVVYKDLVILGNGVGDRLMYRNDPPGDVRAFDARTGKQVWSFHPIPQKGEFGNDTWNNDSWKFTGHTNVWAPFTLDEARGLIYLPVGTPSNDFYGGRRPGHNLFAESLVCLDASTGERKWHFQMVHHGLWDYDLPGPPNLTTISVNGKRIDVVVQLTKMGFTFVFDRVTGEPVWPIEERPVPQTDVPGEQTAATQPFPTKPPAFSPQGMTLEDAFDLTPELKIAAQAELKKYRLGPLYTPPSLEGTVMRPGLLGGANWGGGSIDPETGILYVKSSAGAHIARVGEFDREKAGARADYVDADYVALFGRRPGRRSAGDGGTTAEFPNGLPLYKPPYGHLTAIDLNAGEIVWQIPFGDTPWLRDHPALKGVKLPNRLGVIGPSGTLTTKGGLIFVGGGDHAFHAVNTLDGDELWHMKFPHMVNATPMTYLTRSGRQFVVVATGAGDNASLVAFTLEASD